MRSFILGVLMVLLVATESYPQASTYPESYTYYASNERVDSAKPQEKRRMQQLTTVLKSLETQYKVRFNYDSKLLKDKSIDENATPEGLQMEDLLEQILSPFELSYEKVRDSYYIILKNSRELADIVVSGTVTDSSGMELPGVSIRLKGSTLGVTTDINGRYSLNIPDGNGTLVFTYVGFDSQEIPVNNRSTINAVLGASKNLLNEVVVVGYGSQRRADITGSVAIVDVSEAKQTSTNDVGNMLAGRVAGVSVTSDGQPGAFPQVKLRGISTFGNSDPLYVIDGVALFGVPREFNPNDVESIQILKDASAGAVYGSRAANGVVIITTKQGKKNTATKVDYSGYYGFDNIWQIMPVTGRENYQTLNNEARINSGMPLAPGNDPSSSVYITDIDTDWQEEGLKTGSRQNHYVSVNGGGASNTYNISLDYFDNQGTFEGIGPDYKRYTGRLNNTQEKGRFKFGQTLLFSRSNENALVTGDGILAGARPPLVNDLVFAIPTMPIYDENRLGGYGGTASEIHDAISLNGIGFNSLITNYTDVQRTFGTAFGQVDLVKQEKHTLTYKLNFGYDFLSYRNYQYIPKFNLGYFFPNEIARVTDTETKTENKVIENTITYQFKSNKHTLDVLAGQMFENTNHIMRRGYAEGIQDNNFANLSNGSTSNAGSFLWERSLLSFLGRANYDFDQKYLLSATIRRDESSRFAKAFRVGYFPSAAIGWRISNEDFFEGLKSTVSDLKLRASWGVLGNDNIDDYAYQAVLNPGIVYSFGGTRVLGTIQTNEVSQSLKWEERETLNIGFDAQLFSGNLDLSAEYYNSTSRDILVRIPIPLSVGSINSTPVVNAGSLKNSGIEVTANYNLKVNNDWSFDFGGNISTLKNKVISLGDNVDTRIDGAFRTIVGKEVGRHYGFLTDGLFQSQAEIDAHATQFGGSLIGDVKFKNLNDDNVINDLDRTDLGSGLPNLYFGLNLGANYKSFDFTVFASGAGDYLINSRLYRDLMHTGGDQNYHQDMVNRWTSVNTNTTIPRLSWDDLNRNWESSDRDGWLQSGTYLRINTISLGYTLPKGLVRGVQSARIYATGQNVYTFQKYKGYNPDYSYGVFTPGYDNGSFPKPRVFMFGLQVGF